MLPAHSYPNLKKFATWPNPPVAVPIYWDSWRNNVSNIGFQWDFRHNIVGKCWGTDQYGGKMVVYPPQGGAPRFDGESMGP